MMSITDDRSKMGMAIFWGGFVCGVLDIAYAFALYGALGIGPARLLRGIARGLLGSAAQRGGSGTAVFGLLLHFTVAFGLLPLTALRVKNSNG